ncbi:MAG TPA: HAD-IIA family hydrolase [Thermoleophilaceae bacterium]|nr:HAD-IIA family hydrolase [Thermoleophilaceae bacterium]
MSLSALALRYDQLVLDLDGCVWIGGDPIDGSVEAIAALREAGKRVTFVTNNPRLSAEDYVQRLWRIGVQASLADVVTVGGAVQHLLAETRRGRTAFVVGTATLREHVADAGVKVMNGTDLASRADMVVVGGTDELVYDDLRVATLALRRGADFLATSRDPTHPMPDGLWPGTGAIVAALEYASERTAAIVGKPDPQLVLTAIDRMGDGRTLAVGDRLDTDVAGAAKAGVDAALVLSGGTSAQQAAEAVADGAPGARPGGSPRAKAGGDPPPKPVAVAETLAALVLDER